MSFDKNEVLTLVKEGNVDKLVTYEIFYGRVLRMSVVSNLSCFLKLL